VELEKRAYVAGFQGLSLGLRPRLKMEGKCLANIGIVSN